MDSPRAVVLVEGASDRAALLIALAARTGRDLAAEGVEVLAMGGVTNTRTFATRYGPHGLGVRLTGLYDAPEEPFVRHGLAAAGLPQASSTGDLETLGFFACTADLEDELIRALGIDAVEAVIEEAGETRSLNLLAQMPAQQGWTRHELVRRFLTAKSGRKARYAVLLLDALELDEVPRPADNRPRRHRGQLNGLHRNRTRTTPWSPAPVSRWSSSSRWSLLMASPSKSHSRRRLLS